METKITATYTIDQNDAVLAGSTEHGVIEVDIQPGNLSQEQREALIECQIDNEGRYDLCSGIFGVYGSRSSWEYPHTGVRADNWPLVLLDARIAEMARLEQRRIELERAESAKKEAYIKQVLATPVEHFIHQTYPYQMYEWMHGARISTIADTPAVAAKIREVDELRAARKAEYDAVSAKNDAERKRKDAARAAQIDQWVADHCTENQQGRHALGLLPESEVIDAMRDDAFAPLNDFDRYAKIREADLDHEDFCEGDVRYFVDKAPELNSAQYDAYVALQDAIPNGATIQPRKHEAVCECDADHVIRYSALVKITLGEFEFSREYALPDA